jgi:hypothetical protein
MSGKKKAAPKKRTPLGVPRQRLAVNGRPGYKRRWINAVDGRVDRALEGGYKLVAKADADFIDSDTANRNDSLDNSMSKMVNSDGTKAYLMEIPIVHYTADQKEKQGMIDQTEDALRGGVDPHGKPGAGGRYIPKEGIKIGVK